MANIIISKKYSLNKYDYLKGLVIAIGTPVLPIIQESLTAGKLTFNWMLIATVGLGAAITYLTKNFFTASAVVIKQPNS